MAHAIRALPAIPAQPVDDPDDYAASLRRSLAERADLLAGALGELAQNEDVAIVAAALVRTLRYGGRILIAGNGGSAAEAQHFAAELVGRFAREHRPYSVLALTTDTSILTAIANDYRYSEVFARQVEAHGAPGDALVLFTTSGESDNVVLAAEAARRRAMCVISLTGPRRSRVGRASDIVVRMPSGRSPVVQELHLTLTHVLCEIVEDALACEEEA